MRAMFVLYLVLIAAGLVYFTALGLLSAVKRFLRDNGLSLAFGVLFLGTLVGQAFVGLADFNDVQLAHHGDPISLWRYVRSSEFGVDVLENWQSEYLQFSLFIFGTVWLLQRGSPESKELDKAGLESDEDQKLGEHADRGLAEVGAGRRLAHARCTRTRCCW